MMATEQAIHYSVEWVPDNRTGDQLDWQVMRVANGEPPTVIAKFQAEVNALLFVDAKRRADAIRLGCRR